MSLKRLTNLALFTTLSLAIYAIESAFPMLIPIPGIKAGLANIITMILLREDSLQDASLVLTSRILLATLLFGQGMSLMYSIVGGYLSLIVLFCVNRLLKGNYLYLTGALGGLTHNMGQLVVAFLLTSVPAVLAYLPYLALSGILAGCFTGLTAGYCRKLLSKIDGNHF